MVMGEMFCFEELFDMPQTHSLRTYLLNTYYVSGFLGLDSTR